MQRCGGALAGAPGRLAERGGSSADVKERHGWRSARGSTGEGGHTDDANALAGKWVTPLPSRWTRRLNPARAKDRVSGEAPQWLAIVVPTIR